MKSWIPIIAALVALLGAASTSLAQRPDPPGRGICSPDDPDARADIMTLLTGEENEGARERAGLAGVDPADLAVVEAHDVCAHLKNQFQKDYRVQGAKSPYIATYYRVGDRYIVHIIPRDVAEPAPAPAGAVNIAGSRVLLLVYDQDFTELRAFLL